MAGTARERKRQKREQSKKARLQKRSKRLERERLDDYTCLAEEAFDEGDYTKALHWSMKRLKSGPRDLTITELAIRAARRVNDESALYSILSSCWDDGLALSPECCYILGRTALARKDFDTAQEAFEVLLEKANSPGSGVSKSKIKEVKDLLSYAELVQRSGHLISDLLGRRPSPRSTPKAKHASEIAQPAGSSISSKGTAAEKELPTPAHETKDRLGTGPHSAELAQHQGERLVGDLAADTDTPSETRAQTVPELSIDFHTDAEELREAIKRNSSCTRESFELALQAYQHSFRVSYDQLLCLPTLRNVESLWYQEETAAKVMKIFRGRAILADEVGLGKTVEAGMILKEYLLRGLVASALILVPASLVNQWREELAEKFDLPCVTTNDPEFRANPAEFWNQPFIVASIHAARNQRHFDAVTSRSFDIVIVDEAHHLKNQRTRSWKLVDAVQKSFLLLLTATPVQNNLEELYNLVTILKPGHLKTRSAFKAQFVARGNPTDPRNREQLRQLLKQVMVRNTRSVTRLNLPPRYAFTTRVSPSDEESRFYQTVSDFVSEAVKTESNQFRATALRRLLEAAGSCHVAAVQTLARLKENSEDGLKTRLTHIIDLGNAIEIGAKPRQMLKLLKSSKDQKIVFVNHTATLDYLNGLMSQEKIRHELFSGAMTSKQKQTAIDEFRSGVPVLLATGIGGEGHNLQFCNVLINYDLPWNPMEIEQRIGRIHRIGQEREVQVYNFCAAGTVEDRILDILDRKINMFELVVGEMEMILGRLQDDRDFGEMVFEIWNLHREDADRDRGFNDLAARLKRAKTAYEKSKELDEKLFQEDFGI